MTWIPCSMCGGMCFGKCLESREVAIDLSLTGCHQCAFYASQASQAVHERDIARRALTERHAMAATERETALAKRVEELTAERDALQNGDAFKVENETLRARIADLMAARNVADCDLQRVVPRMEAAETERDELRIRLDELRRVIAELVRK